MWDGLTFEIRIRLWNKNVRHLLKRPRIEAMLTMRPPEPPWSVTMLVMVVVVDLFVFDNYGIQAKSFMMKSRPQTCSASSLQYLSHGSPYISLI